MRCFSHVTWPLIRGVNSDNIISNYFSQITHRFDRANIAEPSVTDQKRFQGYLTDGGSVFSHRKRFRGNSTHSSTRNRNCANQPLLPWVVLHDTTRMPVGFRTPRHKPLVPERDRATSGTRPPSTPCRAGARVALCKSSNLGVLSAKPTKGIWHAPAEDREIISTTRGSFDAQRNLRLLRDKSGSDRGHPIAGLKPTTQGSVGRRYVSKQPRRLPRELRAPSQTQVTASR